jgi:hypothetical protein
MTELLYSRGTRSAEEVQREIDSFWDSLESDDDLRKEVRNAGIDDAELEGLDRQEAISVSVRGAGLDPTLVSLVVAFAPTVNAVIVSLWKKVILPRIRRKYGRDAVGSEKPSDHVS